MNKALAILLLQSVLLISGCNKHPGTEEQAASQQKTPQQLKKEASLQLLNDVSGVWSDSSTLVTLYYEDGQIQLVVDDTPILAKIGDIDPENGTVNVLVIKKIDNEEGIFTFKKKMNPEGTGFTLLFTAIDGTSEDLSFVRKVGTDDKNRINNIYRKAQKQADELAAQQAQDHAREIAMHQLALEEAQRASTEQPEQPTEETTPVAEENSDPALAAETPEFH